MHDVLCRTKLKLSDPVRYHSRLQFLGDFDDFSIASVVCIHAFRPSGGAARIDALQFGWRIIMVWNSSRSFEMADHSAPRSKVLGRGLLFTMR